MGKSTKNVSPVEAVADAWDHILTKYVDPTSGKVDYRGLHKEGRASLKSLLSLIAKLDPTTLDDEERLATYINFYNAGMMENILRYADEKKIKPTSKEFLKIQISSIKVSGGNIWNGDYKFDLAGEKVNLDHIEHGLIRGQMDGPFAKYKVSKLDPRIHAAVNCAALSCPRVREKAYRKSNVSKMLDENMQQWLASEKQFKKITDKAIKVNQILYWYYGDFDDYGKKVMKQKGAGDFFAQFVTKKVKDADWMKKHFQKNFNDRSKFTLKLSSAFDFHYNWQINDQRN